MARRNQWGYPMPAARAWPPQLRARVLRLALAALMALGLSLVPMADRPAPTPAAATSAEQERLEADQAWQAVYGGMSDEERMAGVVLEPEGE